MDAVLYKLNYEKSIPYISKKLINDELTDQILRQLNRDTVNVRDDVKGFHENLLNKTLHSLNTYNVVKGGAAIAAHLDEQNPLIGDIDIEVFVDDRDFSTRIDLNNLSSFVPLSAVRKEMHKIVLQYLDPLRYILKKFDMKQLIRNITKKTIMNNYHNIIGGGEYNDQTPVIIFKSYINEAVEVNAEDVCLVINEKMPFKITSSTVNDEYYLIRYSYNLHMISKSGNNNTIKLLRQQETKNLDFFVFDLYFLDVSVKKDQSISRYKTPSYCLKRVFNKVINVESIDNVIADQIESLMYNVFNGQSSKILTRIKRLEKLVEKANYTNTKKTSQMHSSDAEKLIVPDIEKLTVRDIKPIIYALGPILGSVYIIRMFNNNKLYTDIEEITHQVNFPYHIQIPNYVPNCWRYFLCCLKQVFNLNEYIHDH